MLVVCDVVAGPVTMNGDTEVGGAGCSDEDEDEARSHSASRSSAPPDVLHDQDSLDSDRGGALNLVSIFIMSLFKISYSLLYCSPAFFLVLYKFDSLLTLFCDLYKNTISILS